MSKSILLRWKKWGKGKRFLCNSDENIEVESFTYDYFLLIESFNLWLYNKLNSLHKTDLDWLYEKINQLDLLLQEIYKG